MDENFSIHQRSTRPSNIASRMNLLLNLKTLEHLFNKERNVHVCAEKKNHCNRLIFKFESL